MRNYPDTIEALLAQGENQAVEYKRADVRPEGLAREVVAFSNTNGGTMLIGVDDDGTVRGAGSKENLEEWIANVVRNNVVPAINPEIGTVALRGTVIGYVEVPRGQDKPYRTIDGKKITAREKLFNVNSNC